MADKGLFFSDALGLRPMDGRAREIVAREHRGDKPLFVTVRTPRNPEFNALAHVVFRMIAEAIGVPLEAVKMWLKEKTGRYDIVTVKPRKGTQARKARPKDVKLYHSLAFESMSEEAFRAFWVDSEPFIAQLIGGFDSDEGRKILAIMNGDDRNYRQ